MSSSEKILITGGTGFVGSHLVQALQAQTEEKEIHITSLHSPKTLSASPSTPQIHPLDLTQADAVSALIQDLQPSQIYHLASIASVPASLAEPRQVIDNNFALTLNLLEAVRLYAPNTRLLLVSSADIYARRPDLASLDETVLLDPSNPYSASKAAQDLLAGTYYHSYNLDIIRARPFNHFGPGQAPGFVIADFAQQIAAIEAGQAPPVIKVGNLSAARDFTAVQDIVQAYILLMAQGASGAIYNLGSGQATPIQAILDQLLALATTPIQVETDPTRLRPSDNPHICANISKIRTLGWQPQIPLDQALTKVLQYYRNQMI